jgi:hypothetical protein
MTQFTVLLPGGYMDDQGRLHREADLVPLTGRDEERLAESDPSAPAVFVTALLTCCVRRLGTVSPVSSDMVRRLSIADRLYLVLKFREATCGGRIQGTVQCPREHCREKVDIDFWLHDVPIRESTEKGPLYTRELSPDACVDGEPDERCREITFRLPNGDDQEAISRAAEDNESKALDLLLTRCVQHIGAVSNRGSELIGQLSPLARAEIAQHIESVAPSVDLTLAAECPECGREFAVPFDLQRFVLAECQTSRERLYREVHELAYRYHWSEGEIMALPREKRRSYLATLARELRNVSHVI